MLTYDFDMRPIFDASLFAGEGTGAALASAGLTADAPGNTLAMFRNPATAEALRGADPEIKAIFKEAGFGFLPSGQDLPHGTHERAQEDAIDQVMNRLIELHEEAELAEADWNGFDFNAFLDSAMNSRGLSPDAPVLPPSEAAPAEPAPAEPAPATPAAPERLMDREVSLGQIGRFLLVFAALFVLFWILSGNSAELVAAIRNAMTFTPQEF